MTTPPVDPTGTEAWARLTTLADAFEPDLRGWFEADPGRVERLKGFYPTPGFCDELMIYYRCTDLRSPDPSSTAQKDEDEDIEPRTFTIEEARGLVSSGEIVDLKTVAGLSLI